MVSEIYCLHENAYACRAELEAEGFKIENTVEIAYGWILFIVSMQPEDREKAMDIGFRWSLHDPSAAALPPAGQPE